MKKALVLSGGGMRGSYQNGAIKALRELKKADFDIVVGSSIGALNGFLFVQGDFDVMDELWHTVKEERVVNESIPPEFNLETWFNQRHAIRAFVDRYIKNRGVDISPFLELLKQVYNPKKFFESPIDFGCTTTEFPKITPVFVTKEMMKEDGYNWLVATASAFPAFPVHSFKGKEYIDGFYNDNLPIDFAYRLGADEIVAIDLTVEPVHPNYIGRKGITYIYPHERMSSLLDFDRSMMDHMEVMGYNDMMKAYGKYTGLKYTFKNFVMPKYFNNFIKNILMIEHRIATMNDLAEVVRGYDYIEEEIAKQLYKKYVSDEDIFFGILDRLMTLCEMDSEKVYSYKEVRNLICVVFKDCVNEEYPYIPKNLNPIELKDYVSSLDAKGIVEKIVHNYFYPHHELPEHILYAIYPFEFGIAELVIQMLKELGRE